MVKEKPEGVQSLPMFPFRRVFAFAPATPFSLAVLAVVVAAIAFVTNMPGGEPYALWAHSSTRVHESMLLTGPVASLWAGIYGHLLGRNSAAFAAASVPRRARQFAAHVGSITAAWLLATLVGLSANWVWTHSTASWGGPSGWDMLIAVAGMIAITAASYAVGALLPRAVLVPVIPVAVFAYLLSPELVDGSLAVVSPVHHWEPEPRFEPRPSVAILFTIFAAAVTLLASVPFRDWVPRWRLLAGTLLVFGVGLLIACPFMWPTDLYRVAPSVDPICEDVQSVRVCVHPAHEPKLPTLVSAVEQLPEHDNLDAVNDSNVVDVFSETVGVLDLQISPGADSQYFLFDLILGLSGVSRCEPGTNYELPPSAESSSAVASRIFKKVGMLPESEEFARGASRAVLARISAFSDSDFSRYIATNLEPLWNCTLQPENQ